jgi:ribonucleoside-diphosphate reductase subunit M2
MFLDTLPVASIGCRRRTRSENLVKQFSNEIQAAEALICLWSPDYDREHPFRDVLSADQYLHQRPRAARIPFNAMGTISRLRHKAAWAFRWISDQRSTFVEHLGAFGAVEGILFSSSLVDGHLKRHPHPHVVEQIVSETVKIEQEFLTGESFDDHNMNMLDTELCS